MDIRKKDKEGALAANSVVGLFVRNESSSDVASQRRPSSFTMPHPNGRHSEADDLPDITPELIEKLGRLWDLDDAEEQPVRSIINAVREHLDAIDPFLDVLREAEKSWYDCWRYIYKIAQELESALEAADNARFYSVPESLRLLEVRAHTSLNKADGEFEARKIEYSTEVDRRREEIVDIQNKINLIKQANDLSTLSKFDIRHAQLQSDVRESNSCLTLFNSIFSCCKHNDSRVADPDIQTELQLKNLRDHLLLEYNDNLIFKTNSLNEYAEAAPMKSLHFRQEWNAIKARIYHHQVDFYRCQSKDVMLHCIRLYVLAFRAYYLIYGNNPLADGVGKVGREKPPIQKITDDADKVVAKVNVLFGQMIKGMRSHFSLLYCLQPDRCEFTTYLDNFNHIPTAEVRDAILIGNATDEMIERVFPGFQSLVEAFESHVTAP